MLRQELFVFCVYVGCLGISYSMIYSHWSTWFNGWLIIYKHDRVVQQPRFMDSQFNFSLFIVYTILMI